MPSILLFKVGNYICDYVAAANCLLLQEVTSGKLETLEDQGQSTITGNRYFHEM